MELVITGMYSFMSMASGAFIIMQTTSWTLFPAQTWVWQTRWVYGMNGEWHIGLAKGSNKNVNESARNKENITGNFSNQCRFPKRTDNLYAMGNTWIGHVSEARAWINLLISISDRYHNWWWSLKELISQKSYHCFHPSRCNLEKLIWKQFFKKWHSKGKRTTLN